MLFPPLQIQKLCDLCDNFVIHVSLLRGGLTSLWAAGSRVIPAIKNETWLWKKNTDPLPTAFPHPSYDLSNK